MWPLWLRRASKDKEAMANCTKTGPFTKIASHIKMYFDPGYLQIVFQSILNLQDAAYMHQKYTNLCHFEVMILEMIYLLENACSFTFQYHT